MIGNAYPYKETGYSILEEGEIDPGTLQLCVQNYLVADRQGRQVAHFDSKEKAGHYIDECIQNSKNGR